MTRRRGPAPAWPAALAVAALILWACGGGAAPKPSATPFPPGAPLPAGTLVFDSDRTGNYEIFAMPVAGGPQRQLTSDRRYDSWWARVSPQRDRILFYRTPKGTHDRDYGKTSLWMMNADGSGLVELRPQGTDGWAQQGHAEWSPDGRRLVMFGGSGSNPQIYVTDVGGAHAVAVTDRAGVNIDPSWSPDGASIVFIGCPQAICFGKDYEVFTVPSAGGSAKRLTENSRVDNDPYYSPDGARIAWLGQTSATPPPLGVWNVYVMNADGTQQRNLTGDGEINSKPQWSPDGSRIYFHRFMPGKRKTWSIFSVSSAGGDLEEVTPGQPGNQEYPCLR